MNTHETPASEIVYSCYHQQMREGGHFVLRHSLSYQITGSLVLNDGTKTYTSASGMLRLIRRNQLLRFSKQPPVGAEFTSLTLYLDQATLKEYSSMYGVTADEPHSNAPVLSISLDDSLRAYLNSLVLYQKAGRLMSQSLVTLKVHEGLMLLLQAHPQLKNVLFDFVEPHKIDLEAFMNKNYHFNVKLDRFAYLTGRSLATFKRDFKKIFNVSPHKWLLHKRLNEAYFLIQQQGKTPSDIYLDLGFEDLSHFSYVFKKQFGQSPSTY